MDKPPGFRRTQANPYPLVPQPRAPTTEPIYTATEVGETLIWTVPVPVGTQVALFSGSTLKTGDTADGGSPKPGSPVLVVLNIFHDGAANWSMTHGIGPVGAAAFPGLNLPPYPIPAGPGPFPPGSSDIPLAVWDDLVVQHDGLAAQILTVCAVVVLP
jgi:hypothetical protein